MKLLITFLALTFAFWLNAMSQSDNLLIKLNGGTIDTIAISQLQRIQFENILDVHETASTNVNLRLDGNYPNPFSEQTTLEFEIANSGNVEIIIYDNSGKQIQILNCNDCKAGMNSIQWNCYDQNNNHVQNGIYYYEVRFGSEVQSRKMIVVK